MVNDLVDAIERQIAPIRPLGKSERPAVSLSGEQWDAVLSAIRRPVPADVADLVKRLLRKTPVCDGAHGIWDEYANPDGPKAASLLTTLASGRDEWLPIEAAKLEPFVLGQAGDSGPWAGRWFVVRYQTTDDWALFPGYGVGDSFFARFMRFPTPPQGD